MTLMTLTIGICILLFALWLVRSYMPAPWQTPILVLIVLLGLLWLASLFVPGLSGIRIGSR